VRTANQKICLWTGYSFVILYVTGFVLVADFIPPHSPTFTAEQVADVFEGHRGRILLGQSICVMASALFVPWSVAIFCQMLRIETRNAARVPALSYLQLVSGSIGAIFFMLPSIMWIAMAYRAGHAGEYLRLMDDLAWFVWFISTPLFIVQELAVGACVLLYPNRVFKRWVGWFFVMAPTTLVPVCLVGLFKTGPFAWNGLFGFYLPIVLYMVWFHLATWSVHKAIQQEDAEVVGERELQQS